MSSSPALPEAAGPAAAAVPAGSAAVPATTRAQLQSRSRSSLLAHGQPLVWLHGGAMVFCLFMIVGLLVLIVYEGVGTFWPGPLASIRLLDGKTYLGEVVREETYQPPPGFLAEFPADKRATIQAALDHDNGKARRRLYRTGNFELTQVNHHLISDFAVAEETQLEWALVVERLTSDGRFYGFPKAFLVDGQETATKPEAVWQEFNAHHGEVLQRLGQIKRITKGDIGRVSAREAAARLAVRQAELSSGTKSAAYAEAVHQERVVKEWAQQRYQELDAEIGELKEENNRYRMVLTTASGQKKELALAEICRAYPANRLSFGAKLGVYCARWWEFVADEPRHSNSEGGVFPAIWGTAVMTLLMALAVVPFGVMAALYLREYAKAGPVISLVRIAINNLAGVPSIVFGVFGLGFFCYIIGVRIDQLFFSAYLPDNQFGKGGLMWAAFTLALLTLPVVIVATEEAVAAVPRSMREGSFACGASKWQTIWRIVLPRAMPGILTGMILAIARGAGEVAPLMLVGAIKYAPALPVDTVFPYLHPQRSFMHLGFHIFDVGFQSQDSESAKPMVYTTTLLLIVLIATLNLAAMWLRTRWRKRHAAGQF